MPRGDPSRELAITVDPDVHAEVVEAAAAEGVSVFSSPSSIHAAGNNPIES
jgi:predicted HicB family RNase H-like nuclease